MKVYKSRARLSYMIQNKVQIVDHELEVAINDFSKADMPKAIDSLEFVLKSDHEAAMALKDEEIRVLRSQRNGGILLTPRSMMLKSAEHKIRELDEEIQSALQRLAKV